MEKEMYKLRVKVGEDPPEEWSRVLVSFAGHGGIKIIEEFTMECIVEAGPITHRMLQDHLSDFVDIFPYTPGQHTEMSEKRRRDPAEIWWTT